jgi:hypothetical protein
VLVYVPLLVLMLELQAVLWFSLAELVIPELRRA